MSQAAPFGSQRASKLVSLLAVKLTHKAKSQVVMIKFCHIKVAFLFALALFGLESTSNSLQERPQKQLSQVPPIKVLVLFSESTNDLGIDHRIGSQVIKLASQRAKQLNPRLKDIELTLVNDEADCSGPNKIPSLVAQSFYDKQNVCTMSNAMGGHTCEKIDTERNRKSEFDLLEAFTRADLTNRSVRSLSLMQARNELSWVRKRQANVDASIDAIIGPSCEFLVDFVARMAGYWRTPIYSVASIGAKFSRKDIYPTLTRLSPSIDHLCKFIIGTMQQFKWRHMAIIIDDMQVDSRIVFENFEYQITRIRHIIPIRYKRIYFDSFRSDNSTDNKTDSSPSLCSLKAREVLLEARRSARVLLLLLNRSSVIRRLLICAHEIGFNNGEFTFLALNLGLVASPVEINPNLGPNINRKQRQVQSSSRSEKSIHWFQADDEQNNERARQMFESLMVFSLELPISNELDLFVEQTIDMAQREFPSLKFERHSVGTMAVALHDSLLLAVEAYVRQFDRYQLANLNESATSNVDKFSILEGMDSSEGDKETGREISVALMWNESFYDGLISNMHINSNGDQELNYVLSDMEPELGFMRAVAIYSKGTREISLLTDSYIHWPPRINALTKEPVISDQAPPDEPECGFNEDAEHCIDRQNLYVACSITGALLLLVILSGLFGLYKYRQIKYHIQLDDYWWKIEWEDLHFIHVPNIEGSVVSVGQNMMRAMKSPLGSVISAASRHHESNPLVPDVVVTEDGEKFPEIIEKQAPPVETMTPSGTRTISIIADASQWVGTKSVFSSVVRESSIAKYKDEIVIVKLLNCDSIEVSRELLVDLKYMRDHLSDNLAKFMGLCIQPGRMSIVYEFCSRGSLQALLLNDTFAVDWTLKYSIIGDILNGLNYIHTTQLEYHGRLKSTNLVLDSRFTVKITDFGLQALYSQLKAIEDDEDALGDEQTSRGRENMGLNPQADVLSLSVSQVGYNQNIAARAGSESMETSRRRRAAQESGQIAKNRAQFNSRSSVRHLWTAPEHLRAREYHACGSKRGDVYSLAIILIEIFTRREPYHFGSNAKPFWPAIKEEKMKLESVRRQSQSRDQSDLGSSLNSGNRRKSSQMITRLKRLGASVSPSEIDETGSIESSSQSSIIRGSQRARQGRVRGSSINVDEDGESPAKQDDKTDKEKRIDVEEILDQIRMGVQPEPVRPYLPNFLLQEIDPRLIELVRSCWNETCTARPNVSKVRNQLRIITKGQTAKNYLDNLLNRLQEYAGDLERILDEKSGAIVEEKQRTENILNKLLPRFVAERLRRNEPIVPQLFEGVTIYFSDIVGFEKYATILSPIDLVQLLNSLYFSFDSVIDSFDVTKIETILDIFLIASGIKLEPAPDTPLRSSPDGAKEEEEQQQQQDSKRDASKTASTKKKPNLLASLRSKVQSADHEGGPGEMKIEGACQSAGEDGSHYWRSSAEQVARMALTLRAMVNAFRFTPSSASPPVQLNVRIGIHSGKVCAGIVGVKRPKFCLIGDTVNVASRMHTNSKANKIQISGDTRQLLDQIQGFDIQNRGKIEVKGKGLMDTFWLEYAC